MCHCDFIAATYDAGNAIVLPLGNKPGTAAHLDALAYMLSIVYTKVLYNSSKILTLPRPKCISPAQTKLVMRGYLK